MAKKKAQTLQGLRLFYTPFKLPGRYLRVCLPLRSVQA
jgi:hypothetical protein